MFGGSQLIGRGGTQEPQLPGSVIINQKKLSSDSGGSDSQVSVDFFVKKEKKKMSQQSKQSKLSSQSNKGGRAPADIADSGLDTSGVMLQNKNELQTLKYINEGGIIIKRHLFE